MTTAIYARYSSDLQSERSIDDQIAACREFAERRGITGPFLIFADAALSGASMATRPQLLALMDQIRARQVQVIVAEAIDRLSRDQADLHMIRRAATAHGVKLYTISDGEVNGMVAGLQGIMAEAFLVNLADKTRRGMKGVARSGRIAGGLCYGYRAVQGQPGAREIDEAEAEIVRRIYDQYIIGQSPYSLARALNGEGIPGPRGGLWKVNSIAGDRRVGDGILCQELYRGRIVFNRRRFVKNPETGKRSSFINPASEWIVVEAPQLRIVGDDVWEAAQQVRRAIGPLQNRTKRSARLLSGLIVCAKCGGAFTIENRDRLCCANAKSGNAMCGVRERIPAPIVERRVIDGLKRTLLAPDVIAEAVRAYQEERKALRKQEASRRRDLERTIEEATRRAGRIADQLIDSPSPTLKTKLAEAEAQVAEARGELAALPEPIVVEMHPNAADTYRSRIETLETALAADAAPDVKAAARGLLDRIEVAPDANQPDGWAIVIHGELAALLALGKEKAPGVSTGGLRLRSERTVTLGAGARTHRRSASIRIAA